MEKAFIIVGVGYSKENILCLPVDLPTHQLCLAQGNLSPIVGNNCRFVMRLKADGFPRAAQFAR